MEIRGYGQHRPWLSSAATVTLKAGDVYEAVIKEKVGDREAIVQLRGVDVRFRFEGEAPRSGRISVQITGQQGEVVEGKVVTPPSSSALPSFETPELRQAAEIVTARQLPLTRETIASLRTFLTEGTGTVEQKLETIQVAASKKLDMTVTQLKAVYEALHGKPLSASLGEIVQTIDEHFSFTAIEQQRSVSFAELRMQLQQERNIDRVMEQARQYAEESDDESLAKAVREAVVFKEKGNESFARSRIMQALVADERKEEEETSKQTPTSEVLKIVRRQVEREPIVAKALSVVKGNETVRQALGEALNEVEQLYRSGQPLSAKSKLVEALMNAEKREEGLQTNVAATRSISLQQAVTQAKQIVRTARNVEEAIQQIKTQLIPHMGEEANVLKESLSRIEQMGQQAKEQLSQALRETEQAAAADVVRTANEATSGTQKTSLSAQAASIVSRLQQETISLVDVVQQIEHNEMLAEDPAVALSLQHAKQTIHSQREQLLTAFAQLNAQNRNVRDIVQQAIKAVQREADIKVALETVQTETIPALHAHGDAEQRLVMALEQAKQLSEEGREMAARQTMLQALSNIAQTLPVEQPTIEAEWQAALQLQAKDIIVQTVTKRMAEAAHHFKQVKRDMMRNLSATDQLITQYKQAARPQAKQLLETTIKQLDQTILKSDVMLFADMAMEKKLLQASSQLAEAKKLLDKGQMGDAQKIVKEVKYVLEQMQFKPSDTKVKHFISSESLKQEAPEKALLSEWNKIVQPEPSARHLFDTVRRLGLTYESEMANALVLGETKQEETEATLKGLLTKLAQTGNEAVAKQAEQAVTHLTGQQLLNKGDQGSAMQTLFFAIPLLLQKEVKDVKVYVNARNDGKRIDWENCSLYFLLETNKLGDIGVLLSANERTLSLTFRNNREDFAEKMRPLVDTAKEKLEEIGYRVGNVQFTTFAEKQKETVATTQKRATWTEKGYDFTI